MNDTEIKIEKNVPLPTNGTPHTGVSIAMRNMKVGESFVYKTAKGHSGNFHAIARMNQIQIVTRRQPDGIYRIWRKA